MDSTLKIISVLMISLFVIAGVYADIAPIPGGGGSGLNVLLAPLLIVAVLAAGAIALGCIALISWLVIRRMRKKKAPEKPVDSAPQEQPKAG